MQQVRIGSQLFINKNDTPEQIADWVSRMHKDGLSLIRLFVFWDHVEPREGTWDFPLYDACFRQAETLGLGVVPTLMAVSPPGWMRASAGPQSTGNLNDPALWDKALDYVRQVVARYKDSPALDSWILWNEPSRIITPDAHSLRDFRAFLRERYQDDIEALNAKHFWQYADFNEIELPAQQGEQAGFGGYVEALDWMRFAVADLQKRLSDLGEAVRALDTTHPIHVNPHALAGNNLASGQSIWQEAKVVDLLGCSAHPAWHATRFRRERMHQAVAYFADLIRSASPGPDDLFWVSELQGGTTVMSGLEPFCPSAEQIRHWLWESIGAGARAVVFWCYNTRNAGYEAGEWGLLNQQGEPSPRLEAVSQVVATLKAHQALFEQARAPRSPVRILYSDANIALAGVDGRGSRGNSRDNPRNDLMALDALVGAYQLCADLGHHALFVSEEQLEEENSLEGAELLLLPGMTVLSRPALETVEDFVRGGGTVIADGLLAYKDADGVLAPETRQQAAELFGCDMQDIMAQLSPFMIQEQIPFPGWFLEIPLTPDDAAEVSGTFASGAHAVVTHTLEQGRAVRIGTVFFQRYFAHPDAPHRRLLSPYLAELSRGLVILDNPSAMLRLRTLDTQDGVLCFLFNYGAMKTAVLHTETQGTLTELGEPRPLTGQRGAYRVLLDQGAMRIFYWQPQSETAEAEGEESAEA